MLSIPHIPPGRAELTWSAEGDRGLQYTVRTAGGQPALLNPGMLVVALMADGIRTLGDIGEAVRRHGLSIEDPALVVLTFRRLEQAGAVEMQWHFSTSGPIRHTCVGCGRSCEGHLIGPLSDGEVERLVALKRELDALEPGLPAGDPVLLFETESGPRPALNTRSGRCIFLTEQARCALHKHFGPHAKPLKCQLFPLRVIETEEGFRVGISSRCAMAHLSYRTAQPTTPREELEARNLRRPPGDLVSLDPVSQRSLRPTEAARQNRQWEDFYLGLLDRPEIALSDVVASSDGTWRPGSNLSTAYLHRVAALLRRFAERYACDPLNRPGSAFGDGVRELLRDLRALPSAPTWQEPPAGVTDYLLQALRQYVFLRETAAFGSVRVAFQIAIIGLLGAIWAAEPLADEQGQPSDRVAQYISYWLRIHNGGRAVRDLLDAPAELDELERLLAESS